MDQNTGLVVLGTAVGSKDLIVKLLGPTADYLGEELQSFTQKRIENIKNIFKNAEQIAGDNLDEKGSVPPRVLKGIINEGSYINERLSSEYFGGVLASSRTKTSRDDRGSTYISLLSRSSSYQIRTHYIFYSIAKDLFNGAENRPLNSQSSRLKMKIYIPISVYSRAMGFDKNEKKSKWAILSQAFNGLVREDLVERSVFSLGPADHLETHHKNADEDGIVFVPTPYGIELFTWVHGHSNLTLANFLNPNIKFNGLGDFEIAEGYCKANS